MKPTRLDSEISQPLYLQLRDKLLGMIHEGTYAPHERLPSERNLAKLYRLSRATVRQALAELLQQGVIYSRVGKGTYVSELHKWHQGSLLGFNECVLAQGKIPISEILESKIVPAIDEQASRLQIIPGDELVYLARLRKADGVPIAVEAAMLPHELCPGLLTYINGKASIYSILETVYDLQVTTAEVSLFPDLGSKEEIMCLSLPKPGVVFRVEQLSFLRDGRAIELTKATYRGDVCEYYATVQRSKLGVITEDREVVREHPAGGMKYREMLEI
ncbi:MAG: GntR family transcriptional regulator [Anaerolineaceae bacterium]|nr:MAG: GntR family transcriptional regulator [Anaerolineaceae bacterium]